MNSESAKAGVVALAVAGRLRYHDPEGLFRTIGQEVLIDLVGIHIETGMNDCLDDFVGLNVIASAESSHDRQMHLRRIADASAQLLNGISAIL